MYCRVGAAGRTVNHAIRNRKEGITDLERRQKRELAKQLSQQYPIVVVCQVLEEPCSSLYYKPVEPKANDEVKARVVQLAAAHPTYGYRQVRAMLHRDGRVVDNKRVRRIHE